MVTVWDAAREPARKRPTGEGLNSKGGEMLLAPVIKAIKAGNGQQCRVVVVMAMGYAKGGMLN